MVKKNKLFLFSGRYILFNIIPREEGWILFNIIPQEERWILHLKFNKFFLPLVTIELAKIYICICRGDIGQYHPSGGGVDIEQYPAIKRKDEFCYCLGTYTWVIILS